jgi:hypothetical protein
MQIQIRNRVGTYNVFRIRMSVVCDGKLQCSILVISFVDQELFITNPDPHLDPEPDPHLDPEPDPYQYHVITEGHHGQLE